MHQLGDQWIEIIDGQEHMVKAVEGPCERCDIEHTCHLGSSCPMVRGLVAKDLGILNEDGCLPNGWGEYPVVKETVGRGYMMGGLAERRNFMCITEGTVTCFTELFPTKQEAIDAWNRRG